MKHSRIIAIFSVIVTLLASCGRIEDPSSELQSRTIYFGANDMAIEGFSLWAYQHTGFWASTQNSDILLNNTGNGHAHVTGNSAGTTWSYGTPVLWPSNKQVSFFAYAPHNAATSVYAPGAPQVPIITYEVSGTAGNQGDLIISEALLDKTGPTAASMTFYHALSRIEVSAIRSSHLHEPVYIKRVEFKNLYNTGTVALDTPILWTLNGAANNNYILSVSGGTLMDVAVGDTYASLLPSPGSALLLMPQPLAGRSIAVTFTVGDIEFEWEGQIPSPLNWEPGMIYDYKLEIGGEMVTVTCSELEPAYSGANWNEYAY